VTRTPFERTDDGAYRVTTPVEGMVPDHLSVTVNETTYVLSDYAGKDYRSKFQPDVLLYRTCDAVPVEDSGEQS